VRLLLDSSACIAAMRDRPRGARKRILGRGEFVVSAVVLAELEFGIALSARGESNRVALDSLLDTVTVEPWSAEAARCFGTLRADLQQAGKLIGPYDLLIAAHALSLKLPLMTGNVREFERVPGLEVLSIPAA
jgi:tRNA(fMet)-specific endonuclease VapC